MTNKLKLIPVLLIIGAALIFSSCGEGSSDWLTAAEAEGYEDYIMSSYFMLRGDGSIAESRAAWDYTEEVALPTGSTPTTKTSSNYPEKGQTTTVTIEKHSGDVYKVTNVTSYPKRDAITSTTESYYIKDNNADGYLVKDNGDGTYTGDPICEADGTINSLSRIKFETLFEDGTKREETIYANLDGGPSGAVDYAEFNINDPLVFPNTDDSSTLGGGSFNVDGDEWSPGSGTSLWSSMVTYDQTVKYDILIWTYSKHIIGVRYYTEHGDISSPTRTSVTYERTIAKLSDGADIGEVTSWIKKLFKGRNKKDVEVAEGTTYTETVIRTRIEGTQKKQVKSNSVIYDEAGQTVVTFTANYAEDENGVVTNSGVPVAVY